jgi:hypothetical protein
MSGTRNEQGWEVLTMDGWQDSAFNDDAPCWVMPAWLESYRDLIADTGDQTIEELMNDWTSGFHDNYMRAARVMAVNAQIELLQRLRDEGLLLAKPVEQLSKAHHA